MISAGDDSCVHHCEDKEDDGDSCVECWANSEENTTKGKNKKKKKKSKMLKCDEHVSVMVLKPLLLREEGPLEWQICSLVAGIYYFRMSTFRMSSIGCSSCICARVCVCVSDAVTCLVIHVSNKSSSFFS